ncbi:MAG: nucleotidyltransferase domain-containing protein [Armatimonadota bacterium]|nr:nucleotidyltransferase domain-containing protein [Armatimonadota bacterium]
MALAAAYGERLGEVYLYGSYARGDFTEASDVDILIALRGPVNPHREIGHISVAVSDICLRHDVLITTYPVSDVWLQERMSPLFENIRREGIRL